MMLANSELWEVISVIQVKLPAPVGFALSMVHDSIHVPLTIFTVSFRTVFTFTNDVPAAEFIPGNVTGPRVI